MVPKYDIFYKSGRARGGSEMRRKDRREGRKDRREERIDRGSGGYTGL
jgi:hypothetical protein